MNIERDSDGQIKSMHVEIGYTFDGIPTIGQEHNWGEDKDARIEASVFVDKWFAKTGNYRYEEREPGPSPLPTFELYEDVTIRGFPFMVAEIGPSRITFEPRVETRFNTVEEVIKEMTRHSKKEEPAEPLP